MDDAELISRFGSTRDESAFAAIVERHGPMVLGICRRVLRNSTDAEDAFQATFLLLAIKHRSLRDPSLLANWLYGTATRTAIAARRQISSRNLKQEKLMRFWPQARADKTDLPLALSIDEAIARLPVRHQRVVVSCWVQGMTRSEAAGHLQWAEGTVATRLNEAREMLRKRLRGAVIDDALASLTPAAVPAALLTATVKSGSAASAGTLGAAGIPGHVASIAKLASKTFAIAQLKVAAAIVLAGTISIGATVAIVRAKSPPPTAPPIPVVAIAMQTPAPPAKPPLLPWQLERIKRLRTVMEAAFQIENYATSHNGRLPPSLAAARAYGPVRYFGDGSVDARVLRFLPRVVLTIEEIPADYEGPVAVGFNNLQNEFVSRPEAEERIEWTKRVFERLRKTPTTNPADLGEAAPNAPRAPATLPSGMPLPEDIRNALRENAAAINPLAISFSQAGTSPLGELGAQERYYIEASFFVPRTYRYLRQGVRQYRSSSGYGFPMEFTVDPENYSYQSHSAKSELTRRPLSQMGTGELFFCEFTNRSGYHLPSKPQEIRSGMAESDIVRRIDNGVAALTGITDATLDEKPVKRLTLVADNPDHQWLHRLPPTRQYIYDLAPAFNYAVVRIEERYPDRLLTRTDNSQFEQLGRKNVWLPRQSAKSYFTHRMVPETAFAEPILKDTLSVTELSGAPIAESQLTIKPDANAKIDDRTASASGRAPTTTAAAPVEPLAGLSGVRAEAGDSNSNRWWIASAAVVGLGLIALVSIRKLRRR